MDGSGERGLTDEEVNQLERKFWRNVPTAPQPLQGYLAHKKPPFPRTLPYLEPYGGPRGGGGFL